MIRVETREGIATWTWDDPGRSQNLIDTASLASLEEALASASDPGIRGIVLTSGKDAFCAGADLALLERLPTDAEALATSAGALSRLLRRLETCGKPVVAALNGTAMGGGFEVALACHRRIASDVPSLRLGLPEATLGLLPGGGGTQRVARMVGVQAALPILLEGKALKASEALKLGLVDEVVPADRLLEAARAWLATAPAAVRPWDAKEFQVPGGGPDESAVAQAFVVGTAMYEAKTFGNLPAGRAILSCLWEGLRLPIDAGLKVETRYFVSLLADPVARSMIRTLFVHLGEANRLSRRPTGIAKLEPKKMGVLGAGLMGAGIAHVAAAAGLDVVLLDLDVDRAEKGRIDAGRPLDRAIARGRSSEADRDRLLARIRPTSDARDLAGCDVVVEAVFEDRRVKAEITRRAEAEVGPDALLASNTSTLPITGLAEACERPERFVGLHFFSPVDKMPLVEVIPGAETSPTALAHALDLVRKLGKTPIVVGDERGFYTSRVFGTYVTEGMILLVEGVNPALVENAGKMSGMPMSPLALADEVGLGLMHQVALQTREDLGDRAPAHPSQEVLAKLVAAGRTGKRAGSGFYDWTDSGRRLWPGLAEMFPRGAQPPVDELVRRFLYVQALEAARCVEAGLVSAADADVGAVLGWGFAPWTGGPISYVDRVGARAFVAEADRLAAEGGDRFSAPALLREMARDNRSFWG